MLSGIRGRGSTFSRLKTKVGNVFFCHPIGFKQKDSIEDIIPAYLSPTPNVVVYRFFGAHVPPWSVKIRLGGIRNYGRERGDVVKVGVSRVISHPDYKSVPGRPADVALLKLKRPVTFTDTNRPICLPSPDADLDQFKVCYVTGIGLTSWNGS